MAESPEMATRDEVTDRIDRPSPVDLSGLNNEELLAVIDEALDRLDAKDLTAVMQAAEEKRRDKQDETRERLLRRFREIAEGEGIPLETLFPSYGRGRRRDSGSTLPVRYRGPGGETWSGRGRKPRWLQILESEGHNAAEYRVGDTEPLPPA